VVGGNAHTSPSTPESPMPPATISVPSSIRIAAACERANGRSGSELHAPVTVLKSSTLAVTPPVVAPPSTNT